MIDVKKLTILLTFLHQYLIEKYYKKPQDIEWAFRDRKFYIVQSRSITTL
ncbi:hypothetical protein KAU19_06495 [Candidatus Parcubacteria bacterium]|nr:hypothetical protein [Candidatus Parcubacteria bacterium]